MKIINLLSEIKVYIIFLCFLALTQKATGQQIPHISQFMHNQLVYNPAAAGMHETQFNTNVLSRIQWSSIKGAPLTHLFWSDYRFPGDRMALGVNVMQESFGAHKNTDLLGNFSYNIPLTRKLKLAMGLRLGASFYRYNPSMLSNVWDDGDPLLFFDSRNSTLPKAGAGFQLQSKNMYLGFSAPDLIVSDRDDIFDNKDLSLFQKRRNYILMGGYTIKLNDSYNLLPNLRIIYFPGSGYRADINLIGEISDYFWAGASYSTIKSYTFMAGTHISSRMRFGYSYEFRLRSEVLIPLNTHELNLMINLDNLTKKTK
ncbi:MAG: type IX secretion system membrane protein PorP/SprF [Cytophagaceae bacterium]